MRARGLRRRYGRGAARIRFAGGAPRWSSQPRLRDVLAELRSEASVGRAIRPLFAGFVGFALVMTALPWFVPDIPRSTQAYEPLELEGSYETYETLSLNDVKA